MIVCNIQSIILDSGEGGYVTGVVLKVCDGFGLDVLVLFLKWNKATIVSGAVYYKAFKMCLGRLNSCYLVCLMCKPQN